MVDIRQDDFKWFGEGFDGFPKRLPEDVVEYMVLIIDENLSDLRTRESLQSFQRALNELERKFLKEYIWQRESIKLALVREEGRWILRGRTNFGDSIADEWLIVYFLRELSKQFPNAWTKIHDTDGEFLLIEAANALPKWLNPEVADNRVWINNHNLRIIFPESQTNPNSISLDDALKVIRKLPQSIRCDPEIEEEAFHRLRDYPGAIAENQHHATIPLPRKLATILHANPAYISPAVEAFYLRDPIAFRSLQPKRTPSELRFAPKDWVVSSVRFTKILYAQLRSQEWSPPGLWGKALAKLSDLESDSRGRDKAEIGVKLAAGFEMLMQDKLNKDKKVVREIDLLLEDIESGEEPLPSDDEIEGWGKREDDEGWLDINFEDFEKELSGKGKPAEGGNSDGFGDKAAQENLRKMVERFGSFFTNDDAGLEGAEGLDPMDFDDDDDVEDDDGGQSDDDREIEFDENEFARLMREMMGMPSDQDKTTLTKEARELARVEEIESDNDGDAEEIRKLSERMKAELNEHGALNLDPTPKKVAATKHIKSKGKNKEKISEADAEEEPDGEGVDIDFILAKNMLEAFKGQAGMSGPAGNLMGLMGVRLPPDADDDNGKATQK